MSAAASFSALVVSLDFELYWGVRDHLKLEQYKENLLGVRQAVPAILKLFQKYEIHATWATVGFLFCETKRELLDAIPSGLPKYEAARLSPYGSLSEIGDNERDDPFHYAPSLIRLVKAAPFQEIGTHSLSHYFCLEPEQNPAAFRADLDAALRLARKSGYETKSLVFPRNQYDGAHIAAARAAGISNYRGTERSWIYAGRSYKRETRVRRAIRLVDAYVNLTGQNTFHPVEPEAGMMSNLPASRFLRPYSPTLRALEPLRLRRINRALVHAAKENECFHLWWHPHNFGKYLEENLQFLEQVLARFSDLRARYGMESLNMGEAAARLTGKEQVAAAR